MLEVRQYDKACGTSERTLTCADVPVVGVGAVDAVYRGTAAITDVTPKNKHLQVLNMCRKLYGQVGICWDFTKRIAINTDKGPHVHFYKNRMSNSCPSMAHK